MAGLKAEHAKLKETQENPDFWNDLEKTKSINKRIKQIELSLLETVGLQKKVDDIEAMLQLSEELEDDSMESELVSQLERAEKDAESLFLKTLLKGKFDANNAIVTLHAGAGGTESQDWVSMLYRMYKMYCENQDYKITEYDLLDGDEAGIKSVTFLAEGINAYGYLKAEKGVHRLVRISPFDSNKRRHTSFASVEVMPEIDDDIEVEIKDDDIRIDTYRSSGAGGQHVNKTESAVRITHIPTKTVVQCQNERSQIQNREKCFQMLKSKLIELKEREQMEEAQTIKGDIKRIEWGSQIRSYVFCPYTLVKDHRTGMENSNINAVMDGEIEEFINEYLKKS